MRITYEMTISNSKGWWKKAYVTAPDFNSAVKKMKATHGNGWVVESSTIIRID